MLARKIITSTFLVSAIATAHNVQAGSFSYDCGMVDVSCEQLFNDLVTDKFTQTYDYRRYRIMVYGETVSFSDQSGASIAWVGVVPRATDKSTHNYRPNRWWRTLNTYRKIENAYKHQEYSKSTIREAITSMMAACADSPQCDLLGQ